MTDTRATCPTCKQIVYIHETPACSNGKLCTLSYVPACEMALQRMVNAFARSMSAEADGPEWQANWREMRDAYREARRVLGETP